jgi:hypothetical protein
MKTPHAPLARSIFVSVFSILAVVPAVVNAQSNKKSPASKLYVSDVAGEAQINTGETIEDLNKRSVYSAQGTIIETKRPASDQDRTKAYSTMVYSNGTGAFFDADTRVEIKRFVQEPFVPTRSDMDVEPSISQTQAFVSRGAVGLCTSKLVAGSNMSYSTPFATVNVRGQKVVIEAMPNETRISMLEGESSVKAGTMDMGGHTIHAGQQAIVRPNGAGQANTIEIIDIPKAQTARLDEKVAMACMAKKTVYFDVRSRQNSQINAFNNDGPSERTAGSPITTSDGEIVAIPVVPVNLPVQFTISPAAITTPNSNNVTPGNGTPGPNGPPGG